MARPTYHVEAYNPDTGRTAGLSRGWTLRTACTRARNLARVLQHDITVRVVRTSDSLVALALELPHSRVEWRNS